MKDFFNERDAINSRCGIYVCEYKMYKEELIKKMNFYRFA